MPNMQASEMTSTNVCLSATVSDWQLVQIFEKKKETPQKTQA